MSPVDAQRRESEELWRGPGAVVALAVVILVLVLAADVLGGYRIRLGGIMLALPALAAVFTGPRAVAVIAAVMMPAYVVTLAENHRLTLADAPVAIATAVVISAAAVGAATVRERRARQLAQSRRVTAQTQQTLLRPLPPRLGPMEISSSYLASDAESTIGGDLYACAMVDGRPRVIVGDVQGKGLATLEVVLFVLNAFRRAARQGVALHDLPGFLDDTVRRELTLAWDLAQESGDVTQEPEMGRRIQESFVTAVVVEVVGEGDEVRLVNCGHPTPLLLHAGTARELPAPKPSLPIGLLGLDTTPVHVESHRMEPGDTLLLYTDGLAEARDGSGEFYPLAERVGHWADQSPKTLLDTIQTDLRRHALLDDDVAMVTLRRCATRQAE
ncbi:PP2C family protein-serine/threonine phosphatase [Streptomyces sp. IB2014 016-6]|uniref:PP2C family protein-serine/threonine phosphatase n=1 Tax=Streptomyces sp. IB2014 016-6 TaxID=2517818 RepID=UPI0011CA2FA2|nr:PP2C family protein-serine/threonine phosphatase [Streptomyces sp. IB2014 016-6]TXL89237.1 serine/threonine-protein phosphatase [Streptomyces sp. IB2014 016-6]